MPAKVESYAFPEDVKEELSESMDNIEQNIVRTYYIDSQDLSLYETKKEYNKEKANPFAEIVTAPSANTTNTVTPNNGTNTATGTTTGTNTTTNEVTNTVANTITEDATNTSEFLNNKTGKY